MWYFNALKKPHEDYSIDINKITCITTDGAASMTKCKSGLIALMKKYNQNLKSVHCLIHQESLIAKLGVPDAKKMADVVMSIVNKCISAGATKRRSFWSFLEESQTEVPDLVKM